MKRILLIQGHPDGSTPHFGHALATAYAEGAAAQGHEVRTCDIAGLDFPLLRSQQAWEHEPVPPGLVQAQTDIAWAQHLVLFFPLKSLERNILGFVGIAPVHETLIGMAGDLPRQAAAKWLSRLRALGRRAA
jgi:putative NADPH-quinone reductase